MRKQSEIIAEISKLQGLKAKRPQFSHFLKCGKLFQIEALKEGFDTTAEEFTDLPEFTRNLISNALAWRDGANIAAPSDEWKAET